MGSACWVVIVASTLWAEPVAPPNQTEGGSAMMHVRVKSEGSAQDAHLVQQLALRVTQAFPSPGAESNQRALTVRIIFEQLVEVRVEENEEVWARRTFARPADDNAQVSTLLAMWLFVRSTLTRAAVQPVMQEPVVTVASIPAPPEPLQPKTQHPPLVSRTWRTTVAMAGSVVTQALWSLGVLAQTSTALTREVRVGAEVGYFIAPGLRAWTLHEVPVTLSVATQVPRTPDVSLGVLATVRGKYAVAKDTSAWAVGAAVGPFVQGAANLSDARALTLRAGLFWQPVRQRYVLPNRTLVEPPWAFSLAAGVQL